MKQYIHIHNEVKLCLPKILLDISVVNFWMDNKNMELSSLGTRIIDVLNTSAMSKWDKNP